LRVIARALVELGLLDRELRAGAAIAAPARLEAEPE